MGRQRLMIWKWRLRRSGTSDGGRCQCTRAIEAAVVWSTCTWETGWRLDGVSSVSPGHRRRMADVGVVWVSLAYLVYRRGEGEEGRTVIEKNDATSPSQLLLMLSASRRFLSHLGISRCTCQGVSHALSSSSTASLKDPNFPTSFFSRKFHPASGRFSSTTPEYTRAS